jgi:tetratricopeptide (TPR) repeat protein
MRHASQTFIAICLVCIALCAPAKSQNTLHDALLLENQGQYDAAAQVIKGIVDSGQLHGVELGRAYIMLGFAYRQLGNFRSAESWFGQAIDILKQDPDHAGDYASALENYAALYDDLGQFQSSASLLQKALHLREHLGDHASATRSLLNLAEVDLARNQLREARAHLKQAVGEMKIASDLVDDDRMAFMETQALIEMREGHASAAVAGFRNALELCVKTQGEQHWLAGWQHVLRGKAYFEAGDTSSALADAQKGLLILEHALGIKNPTYVASQLFYSQVLERAGLRDEGARLRAAAEQARKDLYNGQCTGCTINVAGFR